MLTLTFNIKTEIETKKYIYIYIVPVSVPSAEDTVSWFLPCFCFLLQFKLLSNFSQGLKDWNQEQYHQRHAKISAGVQTRRAEKLTEIKPLRITILKHIYPGCPRKTANLQDQSFAWGLCLETSVYFWMGNKQTKKMPILICY